MPELSPELQKARALGIGGSEAAPAMGVHPSVTPFDLYRHKVLGDPWPALAPEFVLWLGHQMEPVAAAAFERETGMALEEDETHFKHPVHHHMLGNIDRRVVGKNEGVELKAWSEFSKGMWGESGTDHVPIGVLCQSIHYLIVTGYDCWHVGALLGTEFRHYTIEPSQKLIDMVIEKEATFWRHVTEESPPDPINLSDVKRLYQTARPGNIMTATAEGVALHRELYEAKQQQKKWDNIVEHHELSVKMAMTDAGLFVHPDDPERVLCTWNDHTTTKPDITAMKKDGIYEAYSYDCDVRPLLVKSP